MYQTLSTSGDVTKVLRFQKQKKMRGHYCMYAKMVLWLSAFSFLFWNQKAVPLLHHLKLLVRGMYPVIQPKM
jgi:hypothetical protein